MINFIKARISLKVALFVDLILFIVFFGASFFLIYQQNSHLEEQLRVKGSSQSIVGAKMVGQIMEEAIDNGVFSVTDAFDTNYQAIPNFDPPKYHTKYDSYLDKAILAVEDEFLLDKSLTYAVAVDINSYVPTHDTIFQKPITGNKEKDKLENRTKRIYDDPIGLIAAKNEKKGFLQIYHRDTGEVLWDFASPIFVKGKHWGGFRVGISLAAIGQAKRELAVGLILSMGVILIISLISVLLYVNSSLIPLKKLTRMSAALADGNIDHNMLLDRTDEIGKLSEVLERLRRSIQIAKSRLTKK
jgi:HAMP domain-containing protein